MGIHAILQQPDLLQDRFQRQWVVKKLVCSSFAKQVLVIRFTE